MIHDQTRHIGCTIGGAVWPQDHADIHNVMFMADQALYRAKAQGKNRALFHVRPATHA